MWVNPDLESRHAAVEHWTLISAASFLIRMGRPLPNPSGGPVPFSSGHPASQRKWGDEFLQLWLFTCDQMSIRSLHIPSHSRRKQTHHWKCLQIIQSFILVSRKWVSGVTLSPYPRELPLHPTGSRPPAPCWPSFVLRCLLICPEMPHLSWDASCQYATFWGGPPNPFSSAHQTHRWLGSLDTTGSASASPPSLGSAESPEDWEVELLNYSSWPSHEKISGE